MHRISGMVLSFGAALLAAAIILGTLILLAASVAEASHALGAVYHGTTSNGGELTLWLNSNGDRVIGLDTRFPRGTECPGSRTFLATDAGIMNHSFSTVLVPSSEMRAVTVTGNFGGPETGNGRVSWQGSAGTACGAGEVAWSAHRSRSIGAIVGGELPTRGGFSLVAYGGGAPIGVVFAAAGGGCASASTTFWVTDGTGEFVHYVPASQVRVVNEAWFGRFQQGVPEGTAMIVRC